MPKKFTAVITKENLNAGTAVPFLTDTEMVTLSVREINLTEKEKLGMIFSPKAIPFEGCPNLLGRVILPKK